MINTRLTLVLPGVKSVRGTGIAIDPERVRRARAQKGLTLAELAGSEVSRTFIYLVERGQARPSLPVLKLIARRTGKPIDYFKRPVKPNAASVELAEALSASAAQVRKFMSTVELSASELEAMRLVETFIRRAALLAAAIKS